MSDFTIEEFENSSEQNGSRFWEAHTFMRILGYETWPSFQSVITKAMGSCAKLGIDPTEAFEPKTLVKDGKDGKDVRSYKLTRFACFLISMHADTKKPEVIKVRVILAAIADQLINQRISEEDLGRIETRADLSWAEKMMCGTAQDHGLQSAQFGIFKDAGFRGMYDMSLNQVVSRKGLQAGSRLYDFIGLQELAGHLFRVTQTTARINSTNPEGLRALAHTANEVGYEVRRIMIRDGGAPPESLPPEEDISKVRQRVKGVSRSMKKLDKPKKRLPPKSDSN